MVTSLSAPALPSSASAYASYLQKVPLFAGLSEAHLQSLARHCRRRKYAGGEALFHEGDPGHTLYILLSGHVKIQTFSAASGEPTYLATRGPNDHFGEMALLDGKPRMADAITTEPCDVLMLDRSEFARCLEASPQIALRVMATLADRLREAAEQLQKHKGLDVLGRVAEALLELMQTYSVEEAGGDRRITVRVSQQELAERVGSTRESVNRALASLKESDCIRAESRQIIVINVKKLRQVCDAP